jgi:uncharacterized protein (TIGR03086 family)
MTGVTIREYEATLDLFRQLMAQVPPDRVTDPTPCASFDVARLIDHTIATQCMITDALRGKPFNMSGVRVAPDAQAEAFDRAGEEALTELRRNGAMEEQVEMPFGSFSAAHLMELCALDTFQHAWDLAKATGQSTDLDRDLVPDLMAVAVDHMVHAPRGEEPAPYGPERTAPDGGPPADRLAAFLGRQV